MDSIDEPSQKKKEKRENTTSAGHNLKFNGHNSSEFIESQLSSALFWRDRFKEFRCDTRSK